MGASCQNRNATNEVTEIQAGWFCRRRAGQRSASAMDGKAAVAAGAIRARSASDGRRRAAGCRYGSPCAQLRLSCAYGPARADSFASRQCHSAHATWRGASSRCTRSAGIRCVGGLLSGTWRGVRSAERVGARNGMAVARLRVSRRRYEATKRCAQKNGAAGSPLRSQRSPLRPLTNAPPQGVGARFRICSIDRVG